MLKRYLSLFFLLIPLLFTDKAQAQVERSYITALGLNQFNVENGIYTYQYFLKNTYATSEIWSEIWIDISAPLDGRRRGDLGHSGDILDAYDFDPAGLIIGRPPMGVTVPRNWAGSLSYDGYLIWRGHSYGPTHVYGVPKGKSLGGFTVRSSAIPSFRKFTVVPYREFQDIDSPQLTRVDSTFVLKTGVILGPGWMPDQITGSFVKDQINAACSLRAISNCQGYLNDIQRVITSEQRKDNRAFSSYVRNLIARVRGDQGASRFGKFVIHENLQALSRRPPASRAPAIIN